MAAMTVRRLAAVAGAAIAVTITAGSAMADVRAGAEAWARGDYTRAVTEWRGPALAGDADAQFNLGQAYKLGRGVPVSLPQAEIWYQKAAAQGHVQAQDDYGLALFQDGRKADALPWLEKSAGRDEKRAELVLGTMLFNGDGVAKNQVRAYALVSRSSQQGLPQASQTLAQLDGYLTPEERQQGVAMAGRIADQGRSARVAAMSAPAMPSQGRTIKDRPIVTASQPVNDTPLSKHAGGDRAPRATVRTMDVPPSSSPDRRSFAQDGTAGASPVAPARTVPAAVRHDPSPPRAAHVQPAVAAGGRWRVQLGAFHDEGNARALWGRIGGRVGGKPMYVRAGAVVRLQAGPFASKEDAQRACRAAGTSCVVVP